MKYGITLVTFLAALCCPSGLVAGESVSFRDEFKSGLQPGWGWVREQPGGWRTSEKGLELRVFPGNMWGSANNATNVLVRTLPDAGEEAVELAVTVENQPTEQYEQLDLVYYYDDSHMVKIGQERVDGKVCIVMGREEKDRTRTIAIIPFEHKTIRVRFVAQGKTIRGEFRLPTANEWTLAGECDLPVNGAAKVSLQAYQGPRAVERWGVFSDFKVQTVGR
jgi:regulation of enolase protein 1 (concanavalin A-like superfamily)